MSFIPWWVHYPNVNDEILNLDWLLKNANCNTHKIENFINLNTIKYANPILWNITSQYEANTVVVDGQTGNAYISTKAVPSGVHLNRTEYWTQIYNYSDVIDTLEEQIAAANEGQSTTASAPRTIGDLVWLNGLLYRVTAPMIAGDSYVVDSNCVKTTVEDELKLLYGNISTAITNEANARIEADAALGEDIATEAQTRANADTNLSEAISLETLNRLDYIVYQPSDLIASNTNVGLKAGTYNVTSNLTLNAQLVVPKGAIINVASGVTLTLNGPILAGRYKIFEGAGNIVVNKNVQPVGYPEWFGALPENSNIDSAAAIQKTIDIFDTCELSKGRYYVSSTIRLQTTNKKLIGTGYNDIFTDRDSTIVDTRTDSTTILFGSESEPSTINNYPVGITIKDLVVDRLGTCSATSIGIATKWNLHGLIQFVRVKNSATGFLLNHNIYTKVYDCIAIQYFTHVSKYAFRSTVGVTPGVVGNNASIYIQNCSCTGSADAAHYNAGLRLEDAPADTFIDGFETSGYQNGIIIEDKSDTGYSSNDIHLSRIVVDGYFLYGILLDGLSSSSEVAISNSYFSPTTGENTYGVAIVNTSRVSITGNEFQGKAGNETGIAIYMNNAIGVMACNNMIDSFGRPYVSEGTTRGVKLNDIISVNRNFSTRYPMLACSAIIAGFEIQPITGSLPSAAQKYTCIAQMISGQNGIEINRSCTAISFFDSYANVGGTPINETTGNVMISGTAW